MSLNSPPPCALTAATSAEGSFGPPISSPSASKVQQQVSSIPTHTQQHPNPAVALLQDEIAALEASLGPDLAASADAIVARHIRLLHTYNEIKDGAQALIAKYAVMTHTTVTAVHRELGLSLTE